MTDRFESALADMPEQIVNYLKPIITKPEFDATLSQEQFEQLLVLSGLEDDELRVALLPLAAAYSYAPISEFFVWRNCTWDIRQTVLRRKHGDHWGATWSNSSRRAIRYQPRLDEG